MASRVVQSVVDNFLGTYLSRNSDFAGYWLFGFLVEQLGELEIDLLATGEANDGSAVAYATNLARVRFSEQLGKARQDRPGSAELLLERGAAVVVREMGSSPGWVVSATVRATREGRHPTQAHGRTLVAPHDPTRERRSARAASQAAAPDSGPRAQRGSP